MPHKWNRAIAASAILSLSASSIGCGYILHPERRGNQGGYIAGGTLVMDLLWLIPGIIPGAVALIVDFSSGAIYVNGRYALRTLENGEVAVRLPDSTTPEVLELRLVTASHRIVAHQTVAIGPSTHHKWVQLDGGDTVRKGDEKVYFEIVNASGMSARLSQPIAMK